MFDPPRQDTSGLEAGVVLPTVNGAGLKRKGQRGGADAGGERLQTQNGQGDTLSQSSSILQVRAWSDAVMPAPCVLSGLAGQLAVGNRLHAQLRQICLLPCPLPCLSTLTATLGQSLHSAQDNWDAVLELATDTTPSGPGSALSPPGSGGDLAPGTHVRRRVVELMEIVIR